MFNFRSKEQILPNTLGAAAILILVGTLLYMVFVPPPSAAGVARGRNRSRQQLQKEIAQAKVRSKQAETQVGNRLWIGNADSVVAQVLAELTMRAAHDKLQLSAFRPQRSVALSGMTEIPCNLQVSGPNSRVVPFLSSLDAPDTRIALRSIQVSSADGNSNNVTATVGISVYFTETAPAASETGDDNG